MKNVFVESGLGYGLTDFIYSVALQMGYDNSSILRIDLSDVISKKQLETKIKKDAGLDISQIIYHYIINYDELVIIHFDNISNDLDLDAISYIRNLPSMLTQSNSMALFFFSSNAFIRNFKDIYVKLECLTVQETFVVLKNRFDERHFTQSQILDFHDLSEGVIKKLDRIIYYLDDASAQDVLDKKNIFEGISYFNNISEKTLRQIELLKDTPDYNLTYLLVKILAVLKNGESLRNIRKSKIGVKLDLDHIKQLVDMGIAKTIVIDNITSIAKINPIIKDYILSLMSHDEIFNISKEYLGITIIETKDGLKINSTNRKVLEKGFSTEEDNGGYLLVNNINNCMHTFELKSQDQETIEINTRRLNKLLFLSRGYVYALKNASMYNEVISTSVSLLKTLDNIENADCYQYYYFMATSFRMLGKYDLAQKHLTQCLELCSSDDKSMLADCYIEQLYIYEKTDKNKAIELAKRRKKEFSSSSLAYIISDQMMSIKKDRKERIKSLNTLIKKARKLEFHTTANNMVLELSADKSHEEKVASLDSVLSSETSVYNQCRAIIQKYESYIENNSFEKIKEDDIRKLKNVYNYLFNQRFDYLFQRCHSILWNIAEYRKNNDIIAMIYFKGRIIWILNDDTENELRYSERFNSFFSA